VPSARAAKFSASWPEDRKETLSRVAKNPVPLPQGVTATIAAEQITIKGAKGSLNLPLAEGVSVSEKDKVLQVAYTDAAGARMRAGSVRAHLANMVAGVTKGYERKLELVGVGFRAAVAGKSLNLTLGFSHQVVFAIPEGITIEAPTQTEVLIKGVDKQRVGQVAAEIRGIRPPEPYKGKGVKYAGEKITLKEGKKK
jgi:large subunit ribosomal protein L6